MTDALMTLPATFTLVCLLMALASYQASWSPDLGDLGRRGRRIFGSYASLALLLLLWSVVPSSLGDPTHHWLILLRFAVAALFTGVFYVHHQRFCTWVESQVTN